MVLPLALSLFVSPVGHAGDWNDESRTFALLGDEISFSSELRSFYAGPAWLTNALPGSNPVRSRYVLDRAGDPAESTGAYNGYTRTLPDVFDLNLFNNILPFRGPSAGKLSQVAAPNVATIYDYTGVIDSLWNDDSTWGPSVSGYPSVQGDVGVNLLSVSTNVFQNVVGGVIVGTIDHNPTSAAHAGPGVTWQITTTNPIIMDEDGAGAGSARISNTQTVKINSLTIDGSGGLILADNLIITNANPNGGVINIATSISGTGKNVTIVGPGSTLFNQDNTFSGTTTINSGTLVLNVNDSLGGTSSVTVNATGTLLFGGTNATTDRLRDDAGITLDGGTLNTAGLSEYTAGSVLPGMGALTLNSTSTIDLGALSSIIAFADSSDETWVGTLRIVNWTGTIGAGNGTDQVYFGTDAMGLDPSQLDQILFFSDADGLNFLGTATILSTGEVVPVPEPATWIGGALALAALGFTQRRRLRRSLTPRA